MLKGIAAGLAAGALWALVFVAPRMTPGLSAVDLAAGRFASYGLFSALVMVWTRASHQWPTPSQAWAALGLSVLGFSGYYFLLVLAIQDAGTEVPTLIIGTIPLWVMLLGKPAGLKWKSLAVGLVLTALGLVLMMDASLTLAADAMQPGHDHFWRGVAYALVAMVSWTVFAIQNSAWLARHPEVNAVEWTNWLGVATGVGAVLLWLFAGTEAKMLLALENRAQAAIVCIVTGIAAAWLATIFWNFASQRLSASLCGQLIVSETLFALLYSFWWDGAWPGLQPVWAAVLFTLGILASIRAHR